MANDKLLAPSHEIIRCCEALLSVADGALNDKRRERVERINYCAGDRMTSDNDPAGLVSAFNWYAAQAGSEEELDRATLDLGHFVRTPLNYIAIYAHLLIASPKNKGHLTEQQQSYVEEIQNSVAAIQGELNRMWDDLNQKRGYDK